MAENYDPVPDLARLLHAALLGGRDGAAYADRIAERLGLGEDDSAGAIADALREALGLKACRRASDYRTVDLIPDRYGRLVKVASTGTEVVIIPPPEANALFFGAKQRDRFAEAIARALTPGQVPVEPKAYYACCIHCEHDGETDPDLDDERHPHPCREGCRTAVQGQAAQAAGTED